MASLLPLQRALLSVYIAAAFVTASMAADVLTEETRLDVRTKAGPVETVVVADLHAGEVRSLTTASGHPALVTRTADGLRLDLAGESFDVALPDPDSEDAAALPAGARIVKIEKDITRDSAAGAGEGKKTVIVHRGHGDAAAHAGHLDLAMGGPLAEGQRIRVIRQIHRESTQATEN